MSWPTPPAQGTDPWYTPFTTMWSSLKTYIDTGLSGKSSTSHNHTGTYDAAGTAAAAVSAHHDAASADHDDRYFTEAETTSLLSAKADTSHAHTLDGLSDVTAPSPSSGQVLEWNGSAWVSSTPASGVTDHGLLSGLADNDHPQYALSASLGDAAAKNTGTSAGTVAAGNDSRFTDSRTPSGSAGGDLSGTFPNPSVAKINGVTVTGTPSVGQVPTATSGTAASWQTPSGGSSGYATVEDEGTALTARTTLDFSGPCVSGVDATTKTTVTVRPGGSQSASGMTAGVLPSYYTAFAPSGDTILPSDATRWKYNNSAGSWALASATGANTSPTGSAFQYVSASPRRGATGLSGVMLCFDNSYSFIGAWVDSADGKCYVKTVSVWSTGTTLWTSAGSVSAASSATLRLERIGLKMTVAFTPSGGSQEMSTFDIPTAYWAYLGLGICAYNYSYSTTHELNIGVPYVTKVGA